MAEAIARDLAKKGSIEGVPPETFFASAGVWAGEGRAISRETVTALRGLGIESDGRSKGLTRAMADGADLILAMTEAHAEAARELLGPKAGKKVQVLDPRGDLDDPIGQGQDRYDALARELLVLIPARLQELLRP